jgi:hypothetical protein
VKAPFTLPLAGGPGNRTKTEPDPFAAIGDVPVQGAPDDPFAQIGDLARTPIVGGKRLFDTLPEAERATHLDRMMRAELGNAPPPTIREQVASGGRQILEAFRHPKETIKGMATSALDDMAAVGAPMELAESRQGLALSPTPITPEGLSPPPRAMLNTAANVLLPFAPVAGLGMRSAINATLGAVNDAEQPIRGATAGLVLGEALHGATKVGGVARRLRRAEAPVVATPASEAAANAQFAEQLEMARADAVPGRTTVDPVEGFQPTAAPTRRLKLNPRNPEGFEAGADPFAKIGDVVPKKLAPVETEPAAAGLEQAAADDAAARAAAQRAAAEPFRRELAADLGMSVLGLDAKKVGKLTGPQIVAIKEQAGQMMDQITALSKQLADASLPAAEREKLEGMLGNAKASRDGLLEQVITASSQKGRDLNFLRQVAQRTLDPDVWMVNAKKALGDRPLTDDVVANLQRLVRAAREACG